MRTSSQWVLVDTFDETDPAVIGIGNLPKKRIPLTSFFRNDVDTKVVLRAVVAATATSQPVLLDASSSRKVLAEPILGGQDRRPHALWLRIARPTAPAPARPDAHTLKWNLTTGTALRPPWDDRDGSSSTWSIPEALEMVDLGSNVTDALAVIIDAPQGFSRQLQAVVRRDGDHPRRVNLTVRTQQEEDSCILRGMSHEIGVATPDSSAGSSNLSDLVVNALTNSRSYLAVVDLNSLETIFWYGQPPDDIVWRAAHRTGLSRIHPDSMSMVKTMSNGVRTSDTPTSASDTIRLLNLSGHYIPFLITAAPLSIGTSGRAGLVTLTRVE